MTRTAISPRLATSTLENTPYRGPVGDDRAKAARAALSGRRFADVRWVAETGSTNSDLVAAARSGAPEQVLVADAQTAGRGRLGRAWEAPPRASLLASVLVRPGLVDHRIAADRIHLVTIALGLAASEAVQATSGVEARLKWPNDLVVGVPGGERKLAGVLAETLVEQGRIVAVIAGIGLNVSWPEDVPEHLRDIATSIDRHAASVPQVVELLVELLRRFEDLLSLATHDPGALLSRYTARSATIGRMVRVERPGAVGGDIAGMAVGVDDVGALLVDDGGVIHTVHVGDVIHARHT